MEGSLFTLFTLSLPYSSLSGLIGRSLMCLPVAWKMAMALAAGMPTISLGYPAQPVGTFALAPPVAVRSLRSKLAIPIRGGHSAVHKDVAAGDEPTVRSHEQGTDISYFVRSACAPSRGHLEHMPVPFGAWPAQFVLGERG